VHVTIEERVGILAIDHPPLNVLDEATFYGLETAFEQVSADHEVKVIVITGTGKAFCAGANVADMALLTTEEALLGKAQQGHGLFLSVERSPKPVIAAINGRFCLGGGNELAMACHIRIAEEKVKFGQPEIALGLIPGWGGSQRLVRLVGLGRALEMILTGEHIRAQEAQRIGLVNRVVPEGEALSRALRLAKRMASLSGLALARALDTVYRGLDMGYEEALAYEAARFGEMAQTEDMREGVQAFLEKRRPSFQDR
jgi:enoyl-CoA hydratase